MKKNKFAIKLIFAMFLILIIIFSLSLINHKNLKEPEIVAEKLESIENFEKLYQKLKKSASKSTYSRWNTNGILTDGFKTADSVEESMEKSVQYNENTSDDYSKTNVQVEGVDEADIVKTDGKYIYYVSSNKIVIVNANNSKDIKIDAEIEYTNEKEQNIYPQEIFLVNEKLIVIGTKYYQESSYKQYMYYNQHNYAFIKVYNIKDKKNINLEREVEVEGQYLSSRLIGEEIYLVANKTINLYALKNTKIEDVDEKDFQVKYKDTQVTDNICQLEYSNIYCLPDKTYSSYINIVAFNLAETKEANIKTYLGAGNNVYCSENNLYVTNDIYEYKNYGFYQYNKIETAINKFRLSDTKIEFIAQGTVPGTLLNQFSMDEQNGYFRVATTNSTSWNSSTSTNNMYVLDEKMNTVGTLENLAKGEKIYSVRFIGTRAYMVTFVQTDPLFVIDLSNPKEPKVLGELKIPGYSKYLHPYDETHLIGFGEDTVTVNYGYGNVVKTNGMKMAMFDVSDPNNPKEMFMEKIGEERNIFRVIK